MSDQPGRVSVDAELFVRVMDIIATVIKWRRSTTAFDGEAHQAMLWRQLEALLNMGDDGGGTVQERLRGLNADELAQLSEVLAERDKGRLN